MSWASPSVIPGLLPCIPLPPRLLRQSLLESITICRSRMHFPPLRHRYTPRGDGCNRASPIVPPRLHIIVVGYSSGGRREVPGMRQQMRHLLLPRLQSAAHANEQATSTTPQESSRELRMRLLGEILCRAGLHAWRKLYLGLKEPAIRCMRLNCGKIQPAA